VATAVAITVGLLTVPTTSADVDGPIRSGVDQHVTGCADPAIFTDGHDLPLPTRPTGSTEPDQVP
jgi:hypothetical protein